MSQKGRAGPHSGARSGFPLFAAMLIIAGVALLLYNFNLIPSNVWRSLWRFWPVILLIIGVNIFLRNRPWLAGFIVLLILLGTLLAAMWVADSGRVFAGY